MYQSLDENNETAKEIAALQKKIELETKKKAKLLEYNINGDIDDRDYLQMNKACIQAINQAEAALAELEERKNSKADFKTHIDTIRKVLQGAKKDATQGIITRSFVQKYIDKIFVTPETGAMRLEIKIFTGKTCEKYLSDLRGRTGHTTKSIIPYTNYKFRRLHISILTMQCNNTPNNYSYRNQR